jgi:DNA polymerase III subunit delta
VGPAAQRAAQLIVERVEGNLLAAKQELEKLRCSRDGAPIDARSGAALGRRQRALRRVSARLRRRPPAMRRALRVLLGLKSEGVEPTLILWALVRELRGLWQARERERLRSAGRGSGWNLAATPSARALSRGAQAAARAAALPGQRTRTGSSRDLRRAMRGRR